MRDRALRSRDRTSAVCGTRAAALSLDGRLGTSRPGSDKPRCGGLCITASCVPLCSAPSRRPGTCDAANAAARRRPMRPERVHRLLKEDDVPFTATSLPNQGVTGHFAVTYDDSLPSYRGLDI